MAINTFATTVPVIIAEDAAIEEAATFMKQENVGCLIVVKKQNADTAPCGLITDRDIVMHLLANKVDSWKVSVKDIMSQNLLTLKEGQGIREAIAAMCEKGVRRAPIVNMQGSVIGLVSLDDILLLLADELAEVAKIIKKQVC